MKDIIAALFISSALAGITSSAFAGEDSTDRWHGVGPAYYETEGGLRRFIEAGGEDRPLPTARDRAAQKKTSKDSTPKNPARKEGV
jgi:hypothetical protein